MPRLCAATTGICPMKASASSENTNTVTRQRPTTRSWRATVMPAVSWRQRLASVGDLGHRRQRHHHQRRDDEEVGRRVADEDPGRPDQRVQDAADDRPDDPGGVHLGRVQRDRPGQVLLAHQAREDRRVGRPEHGAAAADARAPSPRAGRGTGAADSTTRATPSENTSCSMDRRIRKRFRSTLSASRPPTIGRTRVGPSWAKMMTPTNVAECVRS